MRKAISAEPMADDGFRHFDLKQGRNIPFSPHVSRGSAQKSCGDLYDCLRVCSCPGPIQRAKPLLSRRKYSTAFRIANR